MKKILIVILMLSCYEGVYCQSDTEVRLMVTLSGKDTLELRRFDEDQNLVFHKIFPQYGVSQLLTWKYSNNMLQCYTWSHSNLGFIESEYEYDSLSNVINVYSYELEANLAPKDLMSFHSLESLKNSKEFKKYINSGKRYLKSTQFLKDGQLHKELEYKSDQRVDTIYYSYTDGLLTSRKHIYGHNGAFNELIYKYDELGNQLSWMKVFSPSDTSVIYKKAYKNGLIQEIVAIESGKIASKETFNYSNGKLMSVIKVDAKGVEKIKSDYSYRSDGRIDFIDEINKYMGQVKRTYYFYY